MAMVSSGRQSPPRGESASPGAEGLRKRRGGPALPTKGEPPTVLGQDTMSLEAAMDEERKPIVETLERQAGSKMPAPAQQRPDSPIRNILDISDDTSSAGNEGNYNDGAPLILEAVDGDTYSDYSLSLSTGTTSPAGNYDIDRDSFLQHVLSAGNGWLQPRENELSPRTASVARVLCMLDTDDKECSIWPPHQGTPVLEVPTDVSSVHFPVTAVPGHELHSEPVTDVARALAALDHEVLLFFWVNARGKGLSWDEYRPPVDILRALENGVAGRERFHLLYPTSLGFIPYWQSALYLVTQWSLVTGSGTGHPLDGIGPRWDSRARTAFKSVEVLAERLRRVVLEKKHLPMHGKVQLRRGVMCRWCFLVIILDAVYRGSSMKREIADWDGFFSLEDALFRSDIRPDGYSSQLSSELDDTSQTPAGEVCSSSGYVESTEGYSNTRPMVFSNYTTGILWLTFLAAVPLSIIAFALALKYSDPTPGTTTDGDFWLLFQNCGMQLVSLASIVTPVWGGSVVTGNARLALLVFIGVAGVSTISAPFCYVRLPKAWSGFVVIISGCINAFATLQMALAMHRAKDND